MKIIILKKSRGYATCAGYYGLRKSDIRKKILAHRDMNSALLIHTVNHLLFEGVQGKYNKKFRQYIFINYMLILFFRGGGSIRLASLPQWGGGAHVICLLYNKRIILVLVVYYYQIHCSTVIFLCNKTYSNIYIARHFQTICF